MVLFCLFLPGVWNMWVVSSNMLRSFCSLWGTALRAHANHQVKFVLNMTKLRLLSLKSKLGKTLDKVCGRTIFYDVFLWVCCCLRLPPKISICVFSMTKRYKAQPASTTSGSQAQLEIALERNNLGCVWDGSWPYSEVNAYTRIRRGYTGMGWKTIPVEGERLYWEVYSTIPGKTLI